MWRKFGELQMVQLESPSIIQPLVASTIGMCRMVLFLLYARKRPLYYEPQKWIPRGVWGWGIQIGLFAVCKTNFCTINFQVFKSKHAAFPFSCMQRNRRTDVAIGRDIKGEAIRKWTTKVNDTKWCMWHSNWTIWSPRKLFLQNIFAHF